jgi:hypothetical protein
MPAGVEPCQQAGEMAVAVLAGFRREMRGCLWRRGDALFELADAVLAAPGLVPSLPYLSLEPGFRRGHGMVCQALAKGEIDAEAVRGLLVAVRPAASSPARTAPPGGLTAT